MFENPNPGANAGNGVLFQNLFETVAELSERVGKLEFVFKELWSMSQQNQAGMVMDQLDKAIGFRKIRDAMIAQGVPNYDEGDEELYTELRAVIAICQFLAGTANPEIGIPYPALWFPEEAPHIEGTSEALTGEEGSHRPGR